LAEHLIDSGICNIIIIGRTSPSGENLARLRKKGGNVEVFLCDLQDARQLSNLPHRDDICGIYHCAGVLRDSLIVNASLLDLDLVFNVKTSVQKLTSLCPNLDFTVLFSSTSALLGAGGQAIYSGANTVLDWISTLKQKHDVYSVQWAGWSQIGMSVDTDLKELSGERHISPKVGYQALNDIISLPSGVYSVMDISSWKEFAPNFPHLKAFFAPQVPENSSSPNAKKKKLSLRDFITDVTGSNDFEVSLYALGFDSLDIVNFRNRIQATFDRSLPLTTFLDQGQTLANLYSLLTATEI